MATTLVEATGSEMANQLSQEMGGSIAPRAIKFCGEEMGEAWPPILDASAIAIYTSALTEPGPVGLTMRHLEKTDFGCNSSVIGLMRA
jgi:hypothetical protein